MSQDLVIFKGVKSGVYIYLRDSNFNSIKKELDMKLEQSGSFFRNGHFLGFKGKELSVLEEKELRHMLKQKYKIDVISQDEKNISRKCYRKRQRYFTGIEEGMTRFIKNTLRSGQLVKYNGNIVVFGDINPGAIVEAGGNIIVLGSLRGVVHAGNNGNKNAIIAAFNLQPTQLRIANIISRCPDGDVNLCKWPEVAKIDNEEVIIEPYLRKNYKEEA